MNLTKKSRLALVMKLDLERQAEIKNERPDANVPRLLPKLSATSYGMNSTVNCSALFNTLRTATRLDHMKQVFDATNGGRVTYKGPELRQDDKAVVLELIHKRRNMFGGEIEFAPSTLCTQMGWADNLDSKKRLFACLERLCEGSLRLDITSTDGSMFHLVSGFKWAKTGKWSVTLPDDVTHLFPNRNFTFLNIKMRKQLVPGIQTWLFDFISANDCSLVMTYAALRAASGRPHEDPRQFVEYVKAALTKLQSIGAIVGFSAAKCPNTKRAGVLVVKK